MNKPRICCWVGHCWVWRADPAPFGLTDFHYACYWCGERKAQP